MVNANVPFLLGKKALELWHSKLDMKNNILETCIDGLDKDFKIVNTSGNHYALVLETRKEEVESMLFIDEDKNEEDFVSYKEIKKVHKVNNPKRRKQLIHTCNNA